MYHFLSGYTSKLAGTERGVLQPESTFSACFGAPFLPLPPSVYAEMLGSKIEQFQAKVYVVNTGWFGGPYGVGQRMNLTHTRAMVTAAINGTIEDSEFTVDPIFGLHCPETVEGVPSELLFPRNAWQDKEAYDEKAADLANLFKRNFSKFKDVSKQIAEAGPLV